MKTINSFISGFATGVGVLLAFYFLVFAKGESKSFKYVQLKDDYKIEDVGTLKENNTANGRGRSEGFTRYMLYLNLKGGNTEIHKTEHPVKSFPYWLQPTDTTKLTNNQNAQLGVWFYS